MKEIYLDHAATTYLDPRVKAAMDPYFTEEYGNPGSFNTIGLRAQNAVEKIREKVAADTVRVLKEIKETAGLNVRTGRQFVTVSIVISTYPEHVNGLANTKMIAKSLKLKADIAMYYAKYTGRNKCVIWSDEIAKELAKMREKEKLAK